MEKIKFSIITPTYNRAKTGLLESCINSVKNQKKGNYEYEHIFIDDGSTDETKEFLEDLIAKDKRIKYINQKNSGTPKAIRRGVKEAMGDFIVILADDDFLPKDSLFARSEYIQKNPDVDWFYGKTKWVGDDLKPVKTWTQSQPLPAQPYERMLAENFIQGGTTTIRRNIYQSIKWPDWLKKSDDYYVALELLRPENKNKLGYLDKVVYYYRRHKRGAGMQSFRSLKNKKAAKERWELDNKIRRLHPEGLAFLSSELNESWRENRRLTQETKDLKNEVKYLNYLLKSKNLELEEKNKLLETVLNSRGWKTLEAARKIVRKKK